jgi:titin
MELMEARVLLSTFVVNTVSDLDRAGGLPSGQESLRQAIEDVNADPNPAGDTIDFNISGTGVQAIQPLTDLPAITHAVFIDGYSQPGSSPNTLAEGDNAVLQIELDGSLNTSTTVQISDDEFNYFSSGSCGIEIAGSGTVRGLVINRFGTGIDGGDVIEGNFIGTNPTGTLALGNFDGVRSNGLIGTNGDGVDDAAERNLISGNLGVGVQAEGSQSLVAGNFIGTNVMGTTVLGNFVGIELHGGRVGADGHDVVPLDERNIISGNVENDIFIPNTTSGSVIAGNYVGTDVTGENALVNPASVQDNTQDILMSGSNNRIGTDGDGVGDAAERNVISGGLSQGRDGINLGFCSGNVIAGNYIGTDATGTIALGNRMGLNLSGCSGNRIGADGHDPHPDAERNIISGNENGINVVYDANNNEIAGNYIGTDPTGTIVVGNFDGIYCSGGGNHNIIGTNSDGVGDAAECNIISGNTRDGIDFRSASGDDYNTIAGNYIGTDVSGTQPLGNAHYGIEIRGEGVGNVIGVDSHATNPSAGRNIISGSVGVVLNSLGQYVVDQNIVAGNYLGTDVTGELTLGGGYIYIYGCT